MSFYRFWYMSCNLLKVIIVKLVRLVTPAKEAGPEKLQ